MRKVYKIVLIEPSPILAGGVKYILADNAEFDVICTFENPQNCVGRLKALSPDIIMVNPAIFDYSKRLIVRQLLEIPEHSALVALLSSFIDVSAQKQYEGSIDIYDDAALMTQKLRAAINSHHENPERNEIYNLSDREIEILISVAKGYTNKEIADIHHISVNTVITHRKNINKKISIRSVSGLTVYALLNNLIDQNDVE